MTSSPPPVLPDQMPDSWVEQIQNAAKKNTWNVVILTATITTLLGLGANLVVERYRASNAVALEAQKSAIQRADKLREAQREVFSKLGSKLAELDIEIRNATTTYRAAKTTPKLVRFAQNSAGKVEDLIGEIERFIKEVALEPSLTDHLNIMLRSLTPLVTNSKRNAQEADKLIDYYERQFKSDLDQFRSLLSVKVNEIPSA